MTTSAKHIYIYSPSSAVRDKAAFRRGVRRLKALGHEVEIDADALRSHMRFAGDDATRVAAIGRAAASGADVALISRGGYGLTRILPQVPFSAVARSVERGMHWVGLSDFTALQLGLMAREPGAFTWAGPALGEDFGADPAQATEDNPVPDDIMEACFDDLLSGLGEGSGWRCPRTDRPHLPQELAIEAATLWGGNLSVLVSLLGTPWMPEVSGGILFLEDVNEHPYRLERMLTQLLHAGVLGRQKAVLLGQFNKYKPAPGHDRGFTWPVVVQWLRQQMHAQGHAEVPILTGLPFGHVPTKVLLPVGRPVDLQLQGADVLLYWD